MTYNLTAIDATNSTVEFFREVNTLSGNLLGNGWSIVFFVVTLLLILYSTNDFKKAILGAGAINLILSGYFLMALGIIDWYLPVLYIVCIVIGVILHQDKDYG